MVPNVKTMILSFWVAAGVVWLVGAFTSKRAERVQPTRSRLIQIALALLAFAIGFSKRFEFGLLRRPFVPASPGVAYIGLVFTFIGISFAIWARLLLGGNWSGSVTVKENHTLVKRGPYASVRHPIYSGFLLAVLGTAIAFRELRGLVAIALVFVLVATKARIEEKFMIERFGTEYREYGRRVKALIPFVY
jgi:protein-S-isoprenylcysteine O-methyltransferase Ste14